MMNKGHNSTKYKNITDDCLDTRIPLFNEDAFKQGIIYEAKYIGSMDVARPQNRLEIVSAMRRIRFEFKAKSVKKERVYFKISIEGVFVNLRTQKKTPIKLRLSQSFNLINGSLTDQVPNGSTMGLLLMHHPIYRVFYVSHDSQDLKIFSYIARDSKSTNFKCNVFKALRKTEAMKIVRAVGQAFDVCHRINQKYEETKSNSEYSKAFEDESVQENKIQHSCTQDKRISTSQSAQPVRSPDLIKIEDEAQSDSQSESLSTLDDLLAQSSSKKERKKNVPNSISEPSIKLCADNQNDDKHLGFDIFLSTYLFLNYIISNQLSEMNSNISNEFIKNANFKLPTVESLLGFEVFRSQNMSKKMSKTQLELLKNQLEEEIKFRIKCQTQIEQLANQNKALSTFIKRTLEEIRQNKCESCMLRLSSLDMNTDAEMSFANYYENTKSNVLTDMEIDQLFRDKVTLPVEDNAETSFDSSFFKNIYSEQKSVYFNELITNYCEKEIAFDEIDLYRKLDNSITRNFYKMTSWSPNHNSDYHINLKKTKTSNNPSQCTSETSIANSQDDINKINDKNFEFFNK